MDEIEDVKTAVSEACKIIIKNASAKTQSFKIRFILQENALEVVLLSRAKINITRLDEELGVLIIRENMDFFDISYDNGFMLTMNKNHKPKTLLN